MNAAGADQGASGEQPTALFTDLYELSMAQAYVADGILADASFEVFFRDLTPKRGYALLNGVEATVDWLERFRFSQADLEYLAGLGQFRDSFLDWLANLRFTGDVEAMPEGTAIFPHEPVMRITGPLPLVQLIETRVLNAVHYETVVTTKAARMVDAAAGAGVMDFGARRAHGVDAANRAARASWIAGCAGTSNMVAGQRFGLPVVGTMAHSYIEAWTDEPAAFRAFVRHYPDTVLLVDTYDTLRGVRNVIHLADELGADFRVRAIRIDSGDLAALAADSRALLDAAGLDQVGIVVSGGLDEQRIHDLVADGAPIDGFGVGTELVLSRDLPTLDFAYKLVEFDGQPRFKASPAKATLPGIKQVQRRWDGTRMIGDRISAAGERVDGESLLAPVMRAGARVAPSPGLATVRERATAQREALPTGLRLPTPAGDSYPVAISEHLQQEAGRLRAAMHCP